MWLVHRVKEREDEEDEVHTELWRPGEGVCFLF